MRDGTDPEEFAPEARTYELILREARIDDRDTWRHLFQANAFRLLASADEQRLFANVIALQKLLKRWETDLNARFIKRQKKGEMGPLAVESPCIHTDDMVCAVCDEMQASSTEPQVLTSSPSESVQ